MGIIDKLFGCRYDNQLNRIEDKLDVVLTKMGIIMNTFDEIDRKVTALQETADATDLKTDQVVASVNTMRTQITDLQRQVEELSGGASQTQMAQLGAKVDQLATTFGNIVGDVDSVLQEATPTEEGTETGSTARRVDHSRKG